ncbi:hypothetical protein C8Q76DRAFT_852921 [Earliella scabrosa]|nr:hypothetical protein C8Q76DRAFT_852921 [Earliella scabrosa]
MGMLASLAIKRALQDIYHHSLNPPAAWTGPSSYLEQALSYAVHCFRANRPNQMIALRVLLKMASLSSPNRDPDSKPWSEIKSVVGFLDEQFQDLQKPSQKLDLCFKSSPDSEPENGDPFKIVVETIALLVPLYKRELADSDGTTNTLAKCTLAALGAFPPLIHYHIHHPTPNQPCTMMTLDDPDSMDHLFFTIAVEFTSLSKTLILLDENIRTHYRRSLDLVHDMTKDITRPAELDSGRSTKVDRLTTAYAQLSEIRRALNVPTETTRCDSE